MGLPHYLAMTAAELRENPPISANTAWMACHFSPYHTCLSNLPQALPQDSVVILDDVTPICGHDPELICAQLAQCVEDFGCRGVLLDLQRPGYREAEALAAYLAGHLPCPLAVSELYAGELDCAVFLPPVPLHVLPQTYFSPWRGREIWLDTTMEGEQAVLTKDGAAFSPMPCSDCPGEGFREERLCCRYRVEMAPDAARFLLWRDPEDLQQLLEEAAAYGVTASLGLYQEWSRWEG